MKMTKRTMTGSQKEREATSSLMMTMMKMIEMMTTQ